MQGRGAGKHEGIRWGRRRYEFVTGHVVGFEGSGDPGFFRLALVGPGLKGGIPHFAVGAFYFFFRVLALCGEILGGPHNQQSEISPIFYRPVSAVCSISIIRVSLRNSIHITPHIIQGVSQSGRSGCLHLKVFGRRIPASPQAR